MQTFTLYAKSFRQLNELHFLLLNQRYILPYFPYICVVFGTDMVGNERKIGFKLLELIRIIYNGASCNLLVSTVFRRSGQIVENLC
ncbi:hypothetical protein SAMN05444682_105107 [Parapedobacter indicus]|uniref:Uncharacterized protein n=1 Tax=Parapedobacter indicus TaxID=1477437 RepID=A0A1I3K772_9SPHI|nr:hypothetical protein CLV26_105107 [Parapedobacter indicus]SFI68160.1 hypothetical protein SAMN05444682_105107 [Parapedobacter indicus]